MTRAKPEHMVAAYRCHLPCAVHRFEQDFEARVAHLCFPVKRRNAIRTTNLPLRTFAEQHPRLKVLVNAFGERLVFELMYAALNRAAEIWRRLHIDAFELRRFKAVRDELEEEHRKRYGPAVNASRKTS